ncbi:MAG: cytochrome c [Bdellovibrionota bacterium]
MTNMKFQIIAVAGLFVFGCTPKAPEMHKEPNVELIQDMMDQPALKAQDYEPGNTKKSASRLPPEHTVPVGYQPYKYAGNPQAAEAQKNPLTNSPETLELGRTKFETYCAVCHGYEGKGDGPVAVKMALKPPALVSGNGLTYSDAGLYHVITDGRGVMSSYAYQIVDANERWAIVNYVRSLQKAAKGGAQ